jgi:mono/diheme cytochrome c family protein
LALRVALLISAALFFGCVKPKPADETREACGSCHARHYASIGTCAECHRGEPSAARKELGHARLLSGRAAEHSLTGGKAVSEGRQLVEATACRRCHTIGGLGNRLATNLDNVVWKREQRELMTSITTPVENMPVFGFDRGQSEALIAFLLNSARPNAEEEIYRVQFVRDATHAPSTFDDKCGGCHRLLTPLGPQGSGGQGPNLSGLLTSFYPKTAPDGREWSKKVLADWVKNPRALKPSTIMPPVPLNESEFAKVLEAIRAPAAPTPALAPGSAGTPR